MRHWRTGLSEKVGTLETGKQADFAVWDVKSPAEIIYGIGFVPCIGRFKAGKQPTLEYGNQS